MIGPVPSLRRCDAHLIQLPADIYRSYILVHIQIIDQTHYRSLGLIDGKRRNLLAAVAILDKYLIIAIRRHTANIIPTLDRLQPPSFLDLLKILQVLIPTAFNSRSKPSLVILICQDHRFS